MKSDEKNSTDSKIQINKHLKDMPGTLRSEVSLYMNKELVERVCILYYHFIETQHNLFVPDVN